MKTFFQVITVMGLLVVLIFACGVNDSSDEVAAEKVTIVNLSDRSGNSPKAREIFDQVDQLPLFGGCEDLACSNQKLIAYIVDRMTYPKEAHEQGLEGKVFVQFVVNEDGSVSDIEVKRSLGGGATEEAVSVVESFNEGDKKWSPGVNNGQEVAVRYTLPFSFKMES